MSTLERKRKSIGQYNSSPQRKSKSNCFCCRKVFSLMCSNVGLFALVIGYSYLGALIFRHFEAPHETSVALNMLQMRNSTIKKLWNITDKYNVIYKKNWTKLVTAEILNFQNEVIQAVGKGFDGRDADDKHPHQWSISSAFLYSLTIITTIGCGKIGPKTNEGKIATIVYALIGIPLMLLFLANTGFFFANCFRYFYRQCCGCSTKRHNITQLDGNAMHQSAVENAHHGHHSHVHDHYHVHHIALNDVGQNQGNVMLHCNSNPHFTNGKQLGYAADAGCNQYGTLSNTAGIVAAGCIDNVNGKICPGGCLMNDHNCTSTLTRGAHAHATPHSTLLRNDLRHSHSEHINSDVQSMANNAGYHDYQISQSQVEKRSNRKTFTVPIILCFLLITGYVLFGAAIVSTFEGWTMLDGGYFCFLAICTIGFGGIITDSSSFFKRNAHYERKVFFFCGYVLTGMALIAMCFILIQELILFRLKRRKRTFKVKDEDAFEEDEEAIAALQNTSQIVDNTEDFDV